MSTIYQRDKVMKRQDEPLSQNQSNLVPEYQDVPIITNNYRYQEVQSDLSQQLEEQHEEQEQDTKPLELKVEKVETQFKLALPAPQPNEEDGLRAQSRQGRHGRILIKRQEDEAFHAQQQLNIKRTNHQIRIFNLDEDENQQSIIQNLNDSSVSKPMGGTPLQVSVSKPNQPKEAEEVHNSFLEMEQYPTNQVPQPLFERQIQQLVVQPSRQKEEVNYYSGQTEDSLPKKQRKILELPNAKGTIKQGLFFLPTDEAQYEMAKVDSRQSLETGILSTSRDEHSSRQILQPLSPQKIKKKYRTLKPLAQTLQRKAETLYQLKEFQKIEKLQSQHKRMKILSNGKFEIVKEDIIDVFGFVCRSIPYDKCMEAAITRNRGWRKLGYLDYDLVTHDGQYLLSTKKMACHLGSTYNLSLAKNSFADSSEYLVGKVQGNFVGTIFNVFTVQQIDINTQQLDATIHYSASCISCQAKTREVQIYMKNRAFKYVELEGADQDKEKNLKELYEFQNNRVFKKIYKFVSKPPKWNPEKEIYTLNLRKKAKYLSVKNMIIVNAEDHSQQGLLLAKKGENQFQFDISYPFTPVIALGVAMSSFDFKLASQ